MRQNVLSHWSFRGIIVLFLMLVTLSACSQQENVDTITPSPTASAVVSETAQASASPASGVVDKGTVHIEKLGERRVFVYLPAGYEANDERYPVVYMHDGQNVFNTNTSSFGKEWLVEENVDQLVADNKMDKVIVIAVAASEGGAERGKEYVPVPEGSIPTDGKPAEEFIQYFINTVVPYADSTYRTIPDPEHRMIMGSSFGAIQALWMGYHHPEVFSAIGALSPTTMVGNGGVLEELGKLSGKPELKIWLDMGVAEGMPIDPLLDLLQSKGFVLGKDLFYQMDRLGTHDEKSWNRRVHSPLLMFAGKEAGKPTMLDISDYFSLLGPEDTNIRISSVATMDNGMDYSVSEGVEYEVLNPDVGQVDKTGKVRFLKPESINVKVTYQGVTKEHQVKFDHYVKVLKLNLSSLVVEKQGEEYNINLKASAKNLNSPVEYLSELVQSVEKMGLYKVKEVHEDSLIIVFNQSPQ